MMPEVDIVGQTTQSERSLGAVLLIGVVLAVVSAIAQLRHGHASRPTAPPREAGRLIQWTVGVGVLPAHWRLVHASPPLLNAWQRAFYVRD